MNPFERFADLDEVLRRLDRLSGPNGEGFYNAACPSCGNNLSLKQLDSSTIYLRCWGANHQCSRLDILSALDEAPTRDVPPRSIITSSNRKRGALQIWEQALPAPDSMVEHYLLARGIRLDRQQPAALRFHPRLSHTRSGLALPAMVALVQGPDGKPAGIHRTWLRRTITSGRIAKADVEPNKMALGPISGGAVRLSRAAQRLGLAEGIESALSFTQLTKIPCWAGLGGNLSGVILPPEVREVMLALDGDEAGDAYAKSLGRRLAREGRTVRIAQAPRGRDWNDLLKRRKKRKSTWEKWST